MQSARGRGARATALFARVFLDALLPLAVAYGIVTFLADPAHINTGDLRQNSLLMGARPFFPPFPSTDPFVLALASSAILLLTAMTGAIAIGVPAGIAYGWSRNGPLKAVAWSLGTFAASLPAFFWAVALELVMILIFFQAGLRFLPVAGFGIDAHLVLPSLALGIRPAAYIFRLTGTAVEQISHTDYVRTAIAKGLRDRDLLVRHVLPNAAPNIIAAVVLGTRGALSSLVIVEFVYIWGGAGLTFVQALGNRRLELASSLALSFAIASALLTLGADLARARVRVTK
jgi:peptide/nickel transport system permease protein